MSDTLDLGVLDIDEFELWYSIFPRKRDRRRAQAAFARARRLYQLDLIMRATRAYASEVEGKPAAEIAYPADFLRREPWRLDAAPVVPPPAPTRRRRRADPSRPRRAPHRTSRVRLTPEEQKAKWCREHGITVAEYERKKGDTEWLEKIKRRGIVT